MKIEELAGEELSFVAFVMDYVELGFQGPIVRCFGVIVISDNNGIKRFPEDGARDKLCEMIGKYVSVVSVVDGRVCQLTFSDGSKIRIVLEESKELPELMHFVPGENEIQVW